MNSKTRKEEYAEMTRQALMDSALELFITKGFHKTSIEDIVQRARVTRGALYHHFQNKEEIFIDAYTLLVKQLVDVVEKKLSGVGGAWKRAIAGYKAFLDYCVDPNYQSIRLDDAIGVLGWKKWRQIDSSYTMKILRDIIQDMKDSGDFSIDSVDYTANMVYSLLVEAALTITGAKERKKAHAQMSGIIQKMLSGLKKAGSAAGED
ncbi:MAG: TetR/AcrR family transcriptional regulator [Thermodesulfobacteriota bacterium]